MALKLIRWCTDGRLRGQLAGAGQSGVVHGQTDQVELVLAVEDREIRLKAQKLRRAPQQAIADVVERAGPDLGRRCPISDSIRRPSPGRRGG